MEHTPESGIALSICIPTFNRAPFLDQTLASITSQAAFESGGIEVIVSDNCSDDDTPAVGRKYADAFPGRVRYHRQPAAVQADQNFEDVLAMGRGVYLKLHNDNLLVRNGSLAEIVKVVRATAAERPVIFFTNGNMSAGNPIEVLTGLNEFVRRVSYFSTWIGGFGMWREEFRAMPDFARNVKLRLVQTDVLLRLMAAGKRAIVLYDSYFVGLNIGKKGGYNIAEVFGQNYLSLLKPYLAQGLLDEAVYQAEKRTILLNHIIPYYFDKENGFLKSGFFPYMQDYLQDDYFFEAIEGLIERPRAAPAAPAAPSPAEYQAQLAAAWRAGNPHNEVTLQHAHGLFRLEQLSAGRRSYGGVTLWTFGAAGESLSIGHFVSIADDVKFLLGGNHDHQCCSTFPFQTKYFATLEAGSKGPIVVADDVWIGFNSVILSGVRIGQGAVVAAGSMVTRDVPPYAIVGGNPARVLKYRFAPEVIEKMLGLDYSRVSDQAILANRDALSEPITADNADAIIARLMA